MIYSKFLYKEILTRMEAKGLTITDLQDALELTEKQRKLANNCSLEEYIRLHIGNYLRLRELYAICKMVGCTDRELVAGKAIEANAKA